MNGRKFFGRWSSTRDGVNCLVQEYRALKVVSDVGVPEAFDLVWGGGRCLCVQEWIDGSPLSPDAPGAPSTVARTLIRILSKAHALGWVHGDVKPANILITRDGRVVLADWELARRFGARADPGTLGWAPACAWEPGHVAHPWNDTYAAAVATWELCENKRAFSGTREDVVAQQATFDFATASDDRFVRWLMRAAVGREALRPVDPLDSITMTRRSGPGGSVADSECADRSGSATAADVDECAHLVAQSATEAEAVHVLRTSGRRRAYACSEIADWIAMRIVDVEGIRSLTCDETVTDRARVAWREIGSRILCELNESTGDWIAIVAESSSRISNPQRDRLVALIDELRGGKTCDRIRVFRTTGSRVRAQSELIERRLCEALATTQAPIGLSRALEDVGGSGDDVLELLKSLVAAGALELRAGTWSCSGPPELRQVLAGCVQSAEIEEPTSNDTSVEWHVRRAESHALDGDTLKAYRSCVRATTNAMSTECSDRELLTRLADAWLEVGVPGGAESVISRVATPRPHAGTVSRLARARLARGGSAGLAEYAAELRAAAESSGDLLLAGRLDAVDAMSTGDLTRAANAIQSTRGSRVGASQSARLEFRVTVANLMRMRGRAQSAVRALQRVRSRARRVGAVRIALACEVNLLMTASGRPSAVVASGWEALREGVAAWGMRALLDYVSAMAARTWCAAGDFASARRVLDRAAADRARFGNPTGRAAEILCEVEAAVSDFSEDTVRRSETCDRIGDMDELAARDALLSMEMTGKLEVRLTERARRGTNRAARAVRACSRLTDTSRISVGQAFALSKYMEETFVEGTGLALHATRCVVKSLRLGSSISNHIMAEATELVWDVPLEHRLGVTALELAWRGNEVSGDTRRRFSELAPIDPARRPIGVRRWEWSLAHIVARAATGIGDVAQHALRTIEESVSALCKWHSARVGRSYRDVVEERCVRAAIAAVSCVGSAGMRGERRVTSELERCIETSTRSSAVVGYKRILSSALSLRATSGVDDVLEATVAGLLEVCRADRAVVLFEAGGRVRAKVGTSAGVLDLEAEDAQISHSLLAKVRDTSGALVIDDAAAEGELGDRPSVRRYQMRAVLACALRTPTRYLGYLYVEDRRGARTFGVVEQEILEGYSAQVALALENAALVEDLRASYRDLSRARSDAVRAEGLRVLGRLATEVAHDLNNLLTAVLGEAQLLLADQRFPDAYAALRVIERAAQDGAECIRRIQSSTRSRPTAEFEDVDLVRVIKDVLEFTRVRCGVGSNERTGGVSVDVVLPTRAIVRGVPGEIREVLTNIVVNAIEAMERGGRLGVAVRVAGSLVCVDVSDTGPGIPPDVLSRLFEPFFSTKGDRGNGLGLSIALGVVRRHGGDIHVRSECGQGTTFTVELPRVRGHDAVNEDLGLEVAVREVDDAAPRFLIVDDDPSVLRVLGQMLAQVGARVDAVVGGDAAVAKIAQSGTRYTCVVTDLYMPGVSGLDVFEQVQRTAPDTRVVVMSGCSTTLEGTTSGKHRVEHTLRKPFDIQAVRRLVSSVRDA